MNPIQRNKVLNKVLKLLRLTMINTRKLYLKVEKVIKMIEKDPEQGYDKFLEEMQFLQGKSVNNINSLLKTFRNYKMDKNKSTSPVMQHLETAKSLATSTIILPKYDSMLNLYKAFNSLKVSYDLLINIRRENKYKITSFSQSTNSVNTSNYFNSLLGINVNIQNLNIS